MDNDKQFLDNPFDIAYKVNIPNWKVLIIDSHDDFHQRVIKSIEDYTFEEKEIEIIHKKTYQEAVSTIISNPDITLAFIDIHIEKPNDGLEIVSYVRNALEDNNIKLIIMSDSLHDEYNTMLNNNINDFITKKSLTPKRIFAVIISKLRSYHDTLKTIQLKNELEELVDSRTVELIQANDKIKSNLHEIKEDQKSGKAIQEKMLPDNPKKIQRYNFEYVWKPALYLSGDILDYFEIDEDHIGFYIADVSGHGISSAFITIYLKAIIHQYIGRYNANGDWTVLDPPKILDIINKELLHEDLDKHLTMFYGIIHTKDNRLIYSTGGHYPYPVIFGKNDSISMDDKGFSLGNFDSAKYQRYELSLPEKFSMLLMTDGILDIMPFVSNSDKEKFILELNDENSDFKIEDILNKIGYADCLKLPDDLTILQIKNY